ncbi:hypothetical protein MNBD_ALPHA06-2120 [hydrothermal vent metagenome]|uniref:Transporter n=1 Tax=hydrothermal vent metagenome TaxID=652676 RepID=A0A3B0S6K0_9ZZZZ
MKFAAAFFAFYLVLSGNAHAAPLTFNTALPVSKNEYILREQLVVNRFEGDRTRTSLVSTVVYGVSQKFALFGTLPYANINTSTGNTSGFGDTRIFGRYTVYQNDFQGGTFRIAPFAGAKLPTSSNATGTASWDVFGGLVATYGSVDWELDAQLSYQINNQANQFEAGDISRADVSLQYRIVPSKLRADTNSFINAVMEANLIHAGQNKINNVTNLNSGGTTLFVVPGLQYVTERYIAEIGLQIPVIQDLYDIAAANDYIFRTGLRFNF